jgi:hypothetical protein
MPAMPDPWKPTPDEIREWAYKRDAVEPCQDWDLALAWTRHEQALFECTADDHCPNRRFILGVLYLVVGNAVRSGFRTVARPIIEGFIARGDEFAHSDIRLWQQRSKELLQHPEMFDYQYWCAGGFAQVP